MSWESADLPKAEDLHTTVDPDRVVWTDPKSGATRTARRLKPLAEMDETELRRFNVQQPPPMQTMPRQSGKNHARMNAANLTGAGQAPGWANGMNFPGFSPEFFETPRGTWQRIEWHDFERMIYGRKILRVPDFQNGNKINSNLAIMHLDNDEYLSIQMQIQLPGETQKLVNMQTVDAVCNEISLVSITHTRDLEIGVQTNTLNGKYEIARARGTLGHWALSFYRRKR